jgi:hypothetical protein
MNCLAYSGSHFLFRHLAGMEIPYNTADIASGMLYERSRQEQYLIVHYPQKSHAPYFSPRPCQEWGYRNDPENTFHGKAVGPASFLKTVTR